MPKCHFWADVMLRQSRVQASRASPAQKLPGLRVVCFKNLSRATFFVVTFELTARETNLMKKHSVLM